MEKEKLEIIVIHSQTLTECLVKLGLKPQGANFKLLKTKLDKLEIDYSHFNPYKVIRDKLNLHNLLKISLKDILIENSSFHRTSLKKRLYKEGLKEPVCELCGQDEIWKGKRMSLILDHINGVYNDNRLENLRIVCPNCNATLDTHGGKNKKRKTKKERVKRIGLSEKQKIKFLNSRKVLRPEKEVVLEEIKKLGYSGTGRKYGVSDNAIRKWIK